MMGTLAKNDKRHARAFTMQSRNETLSIPAIIMHRTEMPYSATLVLE